MPTQAWPVTVGEERAWQQALPSYYSCCSWNACSLLMRSTRASSQPAHLGEACWFDRRRPCLFHILIPTFECFTTGLEKIQPDLAKPHPVLRWLSPLSQPASRERFGASGQALQIQGMEHPLPSRVECFGQLKVGSAMNSLDAMNPDLLSTQANVLRVLCRTTKTPNLGRHK
jgi:hypothetical protein